MFKSLTLGFKKEKEHGEICVRLSLSTTLNTIALTFKHFSPSDLIFSFFLLSKVLLCILIIFSQYILPLIETETCSVSLGFCE